MPTEYEFWPCKLERKTEDDITIFILHVVKRDGTVTRFNVTGAISDGCIEEGDNKCQ